ncbi:sensor histidine kinase [Dokdonella sp.]|uniref:sensor histidine kinase n=1 Tax=Dokdonella sp. TaxID=2291710 RepID=UPI002F40553D
MTSDNGLERTSWVVGAALGLAAAVGALQPDVARAAQQLSQFGHEAWRTQEGLFASPNAMAQTADGYIWIGTDGGLVRFDGIRFVPSNALAGFPSPEFKVTALLGARDGGLWIGTPGAVAHVKDGKATQFDVPGVPSLFVEEADGSLWLVETRSGVPICHLAGRKVDCHGSPTVPLKYASSLVRAADGGLWLGSSSGLCHWYPGKAPADCFLQQTLEPFAGLGGISSIADAGDGSLWVGIGRPGPSLGLGKVSQGRWQPFAMNGFDGSTLAVSSVFQQRDGALWVGTFDQGLYRIQDGRVDRFRMEDGLSSNAIVQNGIIEDRQGTVWVLTSAGIDAFRHQRVSVFSMREGLAADGVESVLPASNGDVWLGNTTLSILRGDKVTAPDHPELFRDRAVTSLLEDRDGHIWIGLDKSLQVYEEGTLDPITGADGGPLGIVRILVQDADGDVWAGLVGPKLVRIRDRKVVEEMDTAAFGDPRTIASDAAGGGLWLGYKDGHLASYKDKQLTLFPPDGVSKGQIRHLLVDADGTLLGATSAGLLIQNRSGRQLIDAAHGLPCESLVAVVKDRNNAVWMSASCGIIEIEAGELERWKSAPSTSVRSRLFDSTDGAQFGYSAFTPCAGMGPDGRIWFATSKFAEVIDPAERATASQGMRVQIESLMADRTAFAPAGAVELPAASRDISVRYTALGSAIPRKVQFRYRLDGRDHAWQDVGSRREAFYTDLPPGAYTFRVEADEGNGTWDGKSTALRFAIPPLFHQTRWFQALCIVAACLAVYGLFRLRLRQMAGRLRQQMKVKNLERERIARTLHDTLLQDTQALVLSFQTVAEHMPADDPVRQMMERTLDRADEVLAEGRDCVLDLREPEARMAELPEALSLVGEELASSHACAFRTIVEGQRRKLTSAVRDEAYRLGREAIINAFRHAQAQSIEVQVGYGQKFLVLQVRDNGKGIDPATLRLGNKAGHWGLIGMRERARELGGKLDIWSGPGPGTEIQLRVPAMIAYWTSDAAPAASWLSRLGLRQEPRPSSDSR